MQQAQHTQSGWYVVHTKPRQEQIALENLERQGYTCYLPKLRIEKIRRRKAEIVEEPMFPRYLFIHLQVGPEAKSWSPIRSTQGVDQLVRFGQHATSVDERIIRLIQGHEANISPANLFEPGQNVLITEGPFAGIQAVFQMKSAEMRVMVLLEMLGKPLAVEIDVTQLKPS